MKRLIKPSLAAIVSFALVSALFWLGGWNFDERGMTAFIWAMCDLYFGGAAFGFVYLTEGQK